MALDAVVFPQDPFANYSTNKDLYSLLTGNWSYDEHNHQLQQPEGAASFDFIGSQTDQYDHFANYYSTAPLVMPHFDETQLFNPTPAAPFDDHEQGQYQLQSADTVTPTTGIRPKRRRVKTKKNIEEIENQRMTHIAVERNRRKQMNEYLSTLRSIMPDSYVQRGDQASIIGGAINFVKELEQQVQLLGANQNTANNASSDMPFSDFFRFPQYSSSTSTGTDGRTSSHDHQYDSDQRSAANANIVADVEVTMVESHANLKVRSRRVPKQLLKFVSGLHAMRLTILHLNVATVGEVVLYSLSVKVEEECELTSVDEIATAVHQTIARIQEEARQC